MTDLERLLREYDGIDPGPAAAALDAVSLGDAAVLVLCRILPELHTTARLLAIEALGRVADARAVPALCEELASGVPPVRQEAARALGRMGDARSAAFLCVAVEDPHPEVRRLSGDALRRLRHTLGLPQLCEAMGRLGDARTIPYLEEVLKSGNVEERETAAAALGMTGGSRALCALGRALTDEAPAVREAAAAGLSRHRTESLEILCTALAAWDPEIRLLAIGALGAIGGPEVVPLLAGTVTDRDRRVRRRTAEVLGELCDSRAVPWLSSALRDPDPAVAARAASSLGQIGDPRAVPVLCTALRSSNADVRWWAAAALVLISRTAPTVHLRGAIPHLRRLAGPLSGTDPVRRQAFRTALQQIEAATRGTGDLPLPADPPGSDVQRLPRPAAPAPPDLRRLPFPVPPPAPLPPQPLLQEEHPDGA